MSCFARGSAERMLHHVYGLGKAPWFNDEVFEGFDSAGCEQTHGVDAWKSTGHARVVAAVAPVGGSATLACNVEYSSNSARRTFLPPRSPRHASPNLSCESRALTRNVPAASTSGLSIWITFSPPVVFAESPTPPQPLPRPPCFLVHFSQGTTPSLATPTET